MTVAELISKLQTLDPKTSVITITETSVITITDVYTGGGSELREDDPVLLFSFWHDALVITTAIDSRWVKADYKGEIMEVE